MTIFLQVFIEPHTESENMDKICLGKQNYKKFENALKICFGKY